MLSERRRYILSALVEEYVQSAHPVASKSLCDRYDLGCSSATVRNELSALEDTGHVFQPHVSAGRVPTDTGYRVFVEQDGVRDTELPEADVDAVHSHYGTYGDEIDDLMRETSALLSRLTSYVAVALAPAVVRATITRTDLVSLAPRRALVVVITDSGQVADLVLDLPEDVLPEELLAMERRVGQLLAGKRADEVSALAGEQPDAEGGLQRLVMEGVAQCLLEADRERLYHGGASALLRQPEFAASERAQPLLRLLEDGLAMLEALDSVIDEQDVVVRIGHENRSAALENMSVVAASFGSGAGEGMVGVIGPTRMDYPRAIAAVRCVSESLSDVVGG